MLDPIPQHPYPSGLAVHDAAETSEEARTQGTARVVAHRPHSDGTFTYMVEDLEGGTRSEWASYFTIPAGMWDMTGDRDSGGPEPAARDGADEEAAPQQAEADVAQMPDLTPAADAFDSPDAPEAQLENSLSARG